MWQIVLQISSIVSGDWVDNLPTSLTASRRHWPLFCPVQVGFCKRNPVKNIKSAQFFNQGGKTNDNKNNPGSS